LGEEKAKTRAICYDDEKMNISLISKENAHVLPGSIMEMEAGQFLLLRRNWFECEMQDLSKYAIFMIGGGLA